jgi:hypothetical protein
MRRHLRGGLAALVAAASLLSSSAHSGTAVPRRATTGWTLVVDDRFNSGGIPAHWTAYTDRYGSGAQNCPARSHAYVKDGTLRLLLRYEPSGTCGPGWYSAGLRLMERYDSVDQRISVRFRVRSLGGVLGHRIIPMRWPASGQGTNPGEEDYCEGPGLRGCTTFLHTADGRQVYHRYTFDPTQWHTMTFVRRNFVVRAWIDGTLVWSYRGNATTLPPTVKHPVLQQECQHTGCPTGTAGSELILIDWIKVQNPAP